MKNIKLNSRQQSQYESFKSIADMDLRDLIRLNQESITNGLSVKFKSSTRVADPSQRAIIDAVYSIPLSILDSMDTDKVDLSDLLNTIDNSPRCAYCGSLTARVATKGSKGRWDSANLDHAFITCEQFESPLSKMLNISTCDVYGGARAIHYNKGSQRAVNVVLSCRSCNHSKDDDSALLWLQHKEGLPSLRSGVGSMVSMDTFIKRTIKRSDLQRRVTRAQGRDYAIKHGITLK